MARVHRARLIPVIDSVKNAAMPPHYKPLCGATMPHLIAMYWRYVDCARCLRFAKGLAKKPAKKRGKEK